MYDGAAAAKVLSAQAVDMKAPIADIWKSKSQDGRVTKMRQDPARQMSPARRLYWRPDMPIAAMARIVVIGALVCLAGHMAHAASQPPHKHLVACSHLPARQTGTAMFYDKSFQGRPMANGQAFDANALTAASRTLPLGTRARVTNQHTQRSTMITITDRGTFHAKHVIIDLSAGAARAIGLTEQEGVAPVVVEPLGYIQGACS